MNKLKRIVTVLNRKQRMQLVRLTFIILIDALVELLGVSIIVPFIDMISNPEQINKYPILSDLAAWMQMPWTSFIVVVCIGIAIVYVIKNVILIYVCNEQFKFTYHGQRNLSNYFMRLYLDEDYTFHLQHNSAELMRDISNDTSMFYSTVLAYLQFITESFVCTVLIVYLLYKDSLITLGVAVILAVIFLLFMKGYKKSLEKLGNERRFYTFKMTQAMQQGFGGIKEIKVAGTEDYFQNEFCVANKKFTDALCKNLFLNSLPKPVMEAICIGSVMGIIAIKLILGAEPENFVPTLAVFAVAAFRLLPSVNKMASYIGTIMHSGVVVDDMYSRIRGAEEMLRKEENEYKTREIAFDNGISVRNVTFKYPDADTNVLENVNLSIDKNEAVAFVGKSGAGKTTIVDLILGLLVPTIGTIEVDDWNIGQNRKAWLSKVGYIPQNIYMLDDTIRNNITFGRITYTEDDVWKALEEAQLAEFVRSLPDELDTVIGEQGDRLSGGQRQRIGIARALIRKPELLVLDEATSALDGETEKAVMESVEHLHGKMTMIIIAHRLSTIEKCDYIYRVENKKVIKEK